MKPGYTLRTRLLISAFSLVLSLGALEIGLRLAGRAYLSRTITPVAQVDYSAETLRVMCIGDSFTFGGLTGRYETYPHYLQEMMRQHHPQRRSQVFNQGVCEYNSWQLLQFLPQWLDMYEPQVVVLLVGSANLFNPWGYDFGDGSGAGGAVSRFFHGLRVVKLARLIYINGSARVLAHGADEDAAGGQNYGLDGHYVEATVYQEAKSYLKEKMSIREGDEYDMIADMWHYHNLGYADEAMAQCQTHLDHVPDHQELLVAMGFYHYEQGRFEQAEPYYVRALQAHPSSRFVRGQASFFYSNAGRDCIKMGRYGDAVDYLFKAIEQNPDDEYHYYAMSRAFGLQSRYDADGMVERCEALLDADPSLRQNQKFMNHMEMFEHRQEWEQRVDEWLETDLEEIRRLCERSGATVVVQNYPVSYPHANDRLQALSQAHELPLVDNLSAFQQVIARSGREPYLFDDDHCTPQGHRLMAETVYGALEAEGLLDR
jgi:tetratricopeptide (TPR) repeat protein